MYGSRKCVHHKKGKKSNNKAVVACTNESIELVADAFLEPMIRVDNQNLTSNGLGHRPAATQPHPTLPHPTKPITVCWAYFKKNLISRRVCDFIFVFV